MATAGSFGGGSGKQGNTVWTECPTCRTWFPVSPLMLARQAPPCTCPACHAEFRPAPEGE